MRLRRHSVSKHSPFINTIPSNDDCHIPCHFERSEESNNIVKHEPFPKKYGFTLAEVLITLGIIGIVAALTMPSLIQKQQEKETVTRLKKFYSSISQAYLMAKNEAGNINNWYNGESGYDSGSANVLLDKITKYMKVSKVCKQEKGCFPDVMYKKLDGKDVYNWSGYDNISSFITSDGMSVFFYSYGTDDTNLGEGFLKHSFGAISVDVNGMKGPNTFGIDMFSFQLTKEGIVPGGADIGMDDRTSFPFSCNKTDCFGNCESCAAWVIYNENMDYMHCDDLSWDGKTKCK